jgi:integrase
MRHTFASHYVMSGGNLLALQKILGHSKFEMTQIYSHLAPDYMAGEIARLSFGAPSTAVAPLLQGAQRRRVA